MGDFGEKPVKRHSVHWNGAQWNDGPVRPYRREPIRLLMLGMPRTGTASLKLALEYLDVEPVYHGLNTGLGKPHENQFWLAAQNAKYRGQGKPFGRKEFDQHLGSYQVISDAPTTPFALDLIEAYPEAKVILTSRDVDTWYDSVLTTLYAPLVSTRLRYLTWTAKLLHSRRANARGVYLNYFNDLFEGDFPKNGKRIFHEHYENVKRATPADNLLEYHAREGWEPLCKFLDLPVPPPEIPFPRINEKEELRKRLWRLIRKEAGAQMFTLIMIGLIVLLIIGVRVGGAAIEERNMKRVEDYMKSGAFDHYLTKVEMKERIL